MARPKGTEFEQLDQMDLPSEAPLFDRDAFAEFLRTHGVKFVHWRAMRCPIGLTDPDDVRQTHPHHANCSNGFIFTKAGEITVGFIGNSKESRLQDIGRMDGSQVNVTLPFTYDDDLDKDVRIAPFDRLYLKEEVALVDTWETFSAHVSGVDRLLFPAVDVSDLIDSNGQSYKQCADFEVVGGQIHWGARRPGVDPKTGKGVVCSVRYNYRPYFYVRQLPHEVRVAKTTDEFGEVQIQLMPKMAVLAREIFFHKELRDDQAKDPEKRQHPEPPSGQFGAR